MKSKYGAYEKYFPYKENKGVAILNTVCYRYCYTVSIDTVSIKTISVINKYPASNTQAVCSKHREKYLT